MQQNFQKTFMFYANIQNYMAVSPADHLEPIFRKVGVASFTTYGIGVILAAIMMITASAIVLAAIGPYSYYSLTGEMIAVFAILIVVGAIALIQGIIVLLLGLSFRRKEIKSGRMLLYIILESISLLMLGVLLLLARTTTPGILLIVGSILFIIAACIYLPRSVSARLAGSITAIVAVSLFIATAWTPLPYYVGMRTTAGYSATFNTVMFTEILQMIAALIACVGALLYAYLAGKKSEPVVSIILGAAAVLFGVGTIVPSLGGLTAIPWDRLSYLPAESISLVGLSIGALIIFTIAGFLILASSGLGFAVYGRRLAALIAIQTPVQPRPVSPPVSPRAPGRVCANCNAPLVEGRKFCGKCGVRVEERPANRFCPSCGTVISPSDIFCGSCGAKFMDG